MNADEIRFKIEQLLAQSPFASLSQEAHKNMASQLQLLFSSADLVTRKEFDAQQRVLEEYRALLATLENRLAKLEAQPSDDKDA
ncbi:MULTISPECIES: accessory factor UbiK family protein [unclassified Oceanobacter]|jgi:BMFP domain-containing protein YqiC|uniref:accessory factor UbiK family protein n=1 Tax=unclassified Oceanobacter TaxID=2620260 RepID=UPI0026E44CDC|nr:MULTISPECIES: accessory factor UbiK family protein [unclassified Oceanobacter]MDO6683426.1 accessory factor UbiK family protein [Oceanobacter sp. 5_MG-2023]MDP2506902.1 accessory factor UbiK family protein [Oceanobacter sp. 3_MG-2023]MDP2547771.1 accessory factor UbiK family protein [Oceanobacter sp. 4_MG-2023]